MTRTCARCAKTIHPDNLAWPYQGGYLCSPCWFGDDADGEDGEYRGPGCTPTCGC